MARASTRLRSRGVRDVQVHDYNWRTPAVIIDATRDLGHRGWHGLTKQLRRPREGPDEATAIATVRAEEMASMLDARARHQHHRAELRGAPLHLTDYPVEVR
ncbi:MAG: hypothetical protein R3B40_31665 [Polyangiales bacterium]